MKRHPVIDQLIERSSLGEATVRHLRSRTSPELAASIVERTESKIQRVIGREARHKRQQKTKLANMPK